MLKCKSKSLHQNILELILLVPLVEAATIYARGKQLRGQC